MSSISERAQQWLLSDDTGLSSKSLCSFMLNIALTTGIPPSDASDRGRCIRLLQLIPEWIPRLPELVEIEKPKESLVFGASGMRTEVNSWAIQIPLILEEGKLL